MPLDFEDLGFGTLGGLPASRKRPKPPLELDVEIETPDGFKRLGSDDRRASYRPTGLSFGTLRGDGFATGGYTVARPILRDYPDIGLLDTHRFVGRNGDIAYEGRLHSDPRTNSPQEQISVALTGWMNYLKSRKCSPLIIDRRLAGWKDMTTQRRAKVMGESKRIEANPTPGWGGNAAAGPGILLPFTQFGPTYSETGEAWFDAGGQSIGALGYSFDSLRSGKNESWADVAYLTDDSNIEGSFDAGTNHKQEDAANQNVTASNGSRKYAVLQSTYSGAAEGTSDEVHAWLYPRVVGTHGLTSRGVEPENGYYLTDIIRYVLQTFCPKVTWAGNESQFVVTQATWHDNPNYPYDILQQLNNLVLWASSMWEERTLYFEAEDLTSYDWQIKTTDPGVEVVFQGDSIEEFANGISVTYTDILTERRRVIYPDENAELRDESENNPANRHSESLWTDTEVPWSCTEAEAVQFGRAYLAEYNRPKRPGTYQIKSGYIEDFAGHWHPGWKPRCSETLGILDHPDDEPRLITSTQWDDESKTLTVTVDAPPKDLESVIARQELARTAANG